MQPTNYWGELSLPTERIPTPLTLLREQAEALTTTTRGVLTGEIVSHNFADGLGGTLRIVAPLLGGYSLAIVAVRYSIYGYPALVTDLMKSEQFTVETEVDYRSALKSILSSKDVHDAIAALLAQSNG